MEEDRKIKISLTMVMLIIAIVIIIIMGILIFIQNSNSDKEITEANDKISTLEKNNSGLKNTIEILQEKIDNIQNDISNNDITVPIVSNTTNENTVTTNSITNNINTNSVTNNNVNTNVISNGNTSSITNSQALQIGEEKYNEAFSSYWNVTCDYESVIQVSGNDYIKVLNSETIKALYTTQAFNEYKNSNDWIEYNGNYYKADAVRGSNIYYIGNELQVSTITDSKIEFISKEKYYKDDNNTSNQSSNATEYNVQNNKFVLIKENGVWKIDQFTLPN
jgi:hypothetical protein